MSKQTVLGILKEIYFDIGTGNTKNYGSDFVAKMKEVKRDINNQISLLKATGVSYSDELMYQILENVGVKKYF